MQKLTELKNSHATKLPTAKGDKHCEQELTCQNICNDLKMNV